MAQYGSEVLAVELANLLDSAPGVPLRPDRVRLDRREIDRRIDRLTEAVRVEVADHGLEKAVGFDLLQAADDVRYVASRARPILLTDQVRLPRSRAAQAAGVLRAAAQG